MLLAGSVSGRPRSKWWWCHDIGYPLLAAEHLLCTAPWSGTPCQITSVHRRTMSPLNGTWKPGFSLATSVLSTLETSWQSCYINSHLPYHTIYQLWPPAVLCHIISHTCLSSQALTRVQVCQLREHMLRLLMLYNGGATTSAIHCWPLSIHFAMPHGLELLAGRPSCTGGLWVL